MAVAAGVDDEDALGLAACATQQAGQHTQRRPARADTLPIWVGATVSVKVPPLAVTVPPLLLRTSGEIVPEPKIVPEFVTVEPTRFPPCTLTVPLFCHACSTFNVLALPMLTHPF